MRAALAAGHEGVMVKDLASTYRFGARGRAWQKVKEFTTVDLVVLAAEWGSGRRKGFLSNLHLGARREDGTFCMVGKTFKGLTDELLRWQTERLQALATAPERPRRARAAGARRRDPIQRRPAEPSLPRRRRACASRASFAIERTSPPARPTRSRRSSRSCPSGSEPERAPGARPQRARRPRTAGSSRSSRSEGALCLLRRSITVRAPAYAWMRSRPKGNPSRAP